MNKWFSIHKETIVKISFLLPIIFVAFISINHVIKWYEITNNVSFSIFLSVGIEIAALSALVGLILGNNKKIIYLPFFLVTLVQFVGNVFYSFSYIDVTGAYFKSWVDLVGSIFQWMGVDPTDISAHKRILALLSGGLLPLISLTFLHMLVKFSTKNVVNEEIIKDDIKEVQPATINQDTLERLENYLSNKYPVINETEREEILKTEDTEIQNQSENIIEQEEKPPIQQTIEPINEPEPNKEESSGFTRVGDKLKKYLHYDNPKRRKS